MERGQEWKQNRDRKRTGMERREAWKEDDVKGAWMEREQEWKTKPR